MVLKQLLISEFSIISIMANAKETMVYGKLKKKWYLHGFRYKSMEILRHLQICYHPKFWQISDKKVINFEKTGQLHGFLQFLTKFS